MANSILRISNALKSNTPDYGWDVFKKYDDLEHHELLGIYDSCFIYFLRAMIGRKKTASKPSELRYCPAHRRFYANKAASINHRRCTEDQREFSNGQGTSKCMEEILN